MIPQKYILFRSIANVFMARGSINVPSSLSTFQAGAEDGMKRRMVFMQYSL
jgi:hypothetical protein